MSLALARQTRLRPALARLSALAPLSLADRAALQEAAERSTDVRVRRELMVEGRSIAHPILMLSGWAARVRLLPDGRRQFLSFLLPGDLIGWCRHPQPIATSTVVTLTHVTVCTPPAPAPGSALHEAFAVSQALEEAHLLAHIARLGRMSAQERIADLLLELHERLSLCGLAFDRSFAFPVTQETLADALGLTAVHVNRMLQSARRSGDLLWSAGRVTLSDLAVLARQVGRVPTRVTGAEAPAQPRSII